MGTVNMKQTSIASISLFLGLLITTILLSTTTACNSTEEEKLTESKKTVTGGEPFHGVLPYREKDAKLALIRPVFAQGGEVALPDSLSVIGVSIDGEDRAYPLYILKSHQVINDQVGDVPVAGSW